MNTVWELLGVMLLPLLTLYAVLDAAHFFWANHSFWSKSPTEVVCGLLVVILLNVSSKRE